MLESAKPHDQDKVIRSAPIQQGNLFLRALAMENHNLKSKYQIEIRQIDRLLTVEEVSPILQIPASSIYKILSGERSFPLPLAIRLGRFWRFKESEVERFIAELGVTKIEAETPVYSEEKRKRGRPPLQPRKLAEVAA